MYSCVVWCVFFGRYCVTPVTRKKKTTKSMNSHQKTQEYIKGKSPLFMLQKKVKAMIFSVRRP